MLPKLLLKDPSFSVREKRAPYSKMLRFVQDDVLQRLGLELPLPAVSPEAATKKKEKKEKKDKGEKKEKSKGKSPLKQQVFSYK